MSIDRCVDKENVVYLHDGVLFRLKKEGETNIFDGMDKPGGDPISEISRTEQDRYCTVSLIRGILKQKQEAPLNSE